MRAKYVTGVTVTDLGVDLPFVENYTVVALNPGATSVTLQFGDSVTGPFATGAVLPAGAAVEVEIQGRFAALEGGSGQVQLIAN